MSQNKYRAVVTGATRGIGFAIAQRLIKDGVEVIATGTKRDAKYPDGAIYYSVDFLNDESINGFISFLKEQKIDILINNAGINKIGEFALIDVEDFDQILRVNL
ncbi:MAG TPA: SDR family oxidoreductase, partial [Candidatus Thioglobus autotrophicus]|nr:SDR family oxidoreductase [Candidatus Thioglobus autotrophicus]